MNGNLRKIREMKALSRKDLAERSGVDESTIYRMEVGRTRRPIPRTIRILAEALDVQVEELTSQQGTLGI